MCQSQHILQHLLPTFSSFVQVRPALMLQDFLRSLNESQESAGMWPEGLLLPFLKLTFSQQKLLVSNRNLLFQGSIFRGYVRFREGRAWCGSHRGWCFRGSEKSADKLTVFDYQDIQDILTLWWQNNDKTELQYGYQGRNLPHGCKTSDDFCPSATLVSSF